MLNMEKKKAPFLLMAPTYVCMVTDLDTSARQQKTSCAP